MYNIIGMLMTSPWVHLGGSKVIPVCIFGYIDETEWAALGCALLSHRTIEDNYTKPPTEQGDPLETFHGHHGFSVKSVTAAYFHVGRHSFPCGGTEYIFFSRIGPFFAIFA